MRLRTDPLIRQPSTLRLVNELLHACRVAHLAGREPEVEFGQVPVEVINRNTMVGAVDGSLQLGEEPFDCVGCEPVTHIFTSGVVDRLVLREEPSGEVVPLPAICDEREPTGSTLPMRMRPRVTPSTFATTWERTSPVAALIRENTGTFSVPRPSRSGPRAEAWRFFGSPPMYASSAMTMPEIRTGGNSDSIALRILWSMYQAVVWVTPRVRRSSLAATPFLLADLM